MEKKVLKKSFHLSLLNTAEVWACSLNTQESIITMQMRASESNLLIWTENQLLNISYSKGEFPATITKEADWD